MFEIVKVHLKFILLWFIFLALGQLLVTFLLNEWFDWKYYFLGSFAAGFFVSVILIIAHFYRLKKLGVDLQKSNLHYLRIKALNSALSQEEKMRLLQSYLQKEMKQISANVFEMNTCDWYGWNKVVLEVLSCGDENIELQITNKPVLMNSIESIVLTKFIDYIAIIKTTRKIGIALSGDFALSN